MKRTIYCSFLVFFLFSYNNLLMAQDIVKVLISTNSGDMTLELYPQKAPITVKNFLRHVDDKLYDGATFYRVVRMDNQQQNNIKIEVIQGGIDPKISPFAPIKHETTKDTGILHKDGVISMARDKPGSATAEFFICLNDQPDLDYGGLRNPDGQGFATFGKVVSGMDVVRNIQKMKTNMPKGAKLEFTSGQILSAPVIIKTIRRVDGVAKGQ